MTGGFVWDARMYISEYCVLWTKQIYTYTTNYIKIKNKYINSHFFMYIYLVMLGLFLKVYNYTLLSVINYGRPVFIIANTYVNITSRYLNVWSSEAVNRFYSFLFIFTIRHEWNDVVFKQCAQFHMNSNVTSNVLPFLTVNLVTVGHSSFCVALRRSRNLPLQSLPAGSMTLCGYDKTNKLNDWGERPGIKM